MTKKKEEFTKTEIAIAVAIVFAAVVGVAVIVPVVVDAVMWPFQLAERVEELESRERELRHIAAYLCKNYGEEKEIMGWSFTSGGKIELGTITEKACP